MDHTYFKKLLYTCTMLSFFLSISALALQESEGIFIGSFEPPIPKGSHFVRVIPKSTTKVAGYEVKAALAPLYVIEDDPVLGGSPGGTGSSTSTTTATSTIDFSAVNITTSPSTITGGSGFVGIEGHVKYEGTDNFVGPLKVACYVNGTLVGDTQYTYTTGTQIVPGSTVELECDDDWSNIAQGIYTLKVVVDPDGVHAETNEINNDHSVSVQTTGYVSTPVLDFEVTDIKVGALQADAGPEVGFFVSIRNNGDTITRQWLADYLKPITGNVKDLTNGMVYGMVVDFICVGCSIDGSETFPHGSTYVAKGYLVQNSDGKYNLRATIDHENFFSETNENNNTLTKELSFKLGDETQSTEKVVACHYNGGVKQYVQLNISQDGWDEGHKTHEKDFIKTGEGTCASLASVGTVVPFDGGATDGPRNVPGLNDRPQTVSTTEGGTGDGSLIKKLQERIRQLEYRLSQREQEVVERERDRAKPANPSLVHRVAGMILLQVKEKGEAWYVDPDSLQKFYLKDGQSAFQALQAFGLGISETDVDQIPVSIETDTDTEDADADGLSDKTEVALGTEVNNADSDGDGFSDGTEVESGFHPRRAGQWIANAALCKRLEGKIVLQVQNRGQAWYVRGCKRYYLKNGTNAYEVMRQLGTGITNEDLSEVVTGDLSTGQ